MTADRADERERNASVPARGIEQGLARQIEPSFGVEHHPERGAVLHAAAGIERLELRPDLTPQAGAEAMERDERRASDGGEDRACDERADPIAGERRQA